MSESPYRNLWVPLVVVPAGIVMVLLCIFLFFGAVSGSVSTLEENLELVARGGANQRKQAAFSLGVQIAENQRALAEGREPPWKLEAGFLPELRRAWEATPEDDREIRLTLACLQAQQGDEQGVPHLLELLEVPETEDPGGELRFKALAQLGALGDPRARDALIRVAGDPDEGLRSMAAIGLQRQGGEETVAALRRALSDPSFDVRANAALSLAVLGDPSGAGILRDLLDPLTYASERERQGRRFARSELVSAGRTRAVEALGRLRQPEDRARIEELAAGDADLSVREAAMRALSGWDGGR